MANKRNIYLINPAFQLKTSLFVASLSFLASIPYPWVIYALLENISIKLSSGELILKAQEFTQSFQQNRVELLIFLIGWQIGFTLFVFAFCIFQSHKVAGPMYKMKLFLKNIKAGPKQHQLTFRKGDHFKDMAETLSETINELNANNRKQLEEVDKVLMGMRETIQGLTDDRRKEFLKHLNEIDGLHTKLNNY